MLSLYGVPIPNNNRNVPKTLIRCCCWSLSKVILCFLVLVMSTRVDVSSCVTLCGCLFEGNPWAKAVKVFDVEGEEYSPGLGPNREEIKEKGCETIHDVMGASCLLFAAPVLALAGTWYMGNCSGNSRTVFAVIICVWQFWTMFLSFMGDYWFARTGKDDSLGHEILPEPSYDSAPQGEWRRDSSEAFISDDKIAWWRKMMIMNKIYVISASGSVAMFAGVMILQMLYGGHFWFYALTTPPLIITAAAFKFYGASLFQQYGETKDKDTLWWGYLSHSLWHLFVFVIPCTQVYGLITHGLATPAWCCI